MGGSIHLPGERKLCFNLLFISAIRDIREFQLLFLGLPLLERQGDFDPMYSLRLIAEQGTDAEIVAHEEDNT